MDQVANNVIKKIKIQSVLRNQRLTSINLDHPINNANMITMIVIAMEVIVIVTSTPVIVAVIVIDLAEVERVEEGEPKLEELVVLEMLVLHKALEILDKAFQESRLKTN